MLYASPLVSFLLSLLFLQQFFTPASTSSSTFIVVCVLSPVQDEWEIAKWKLGKLKMKESCSWTRTLFKFLKLTLKMFASYFSLKICRHHFFFFFNSAHAHNSTFLHIMLLAKQEIKQQKHPKEHEEHNHHYT